MGLCRTGTTDPEQTAMGTDFSKAYGFDSSDFSGLSDFDGQKAESIHYIKSFSQLESGRETASFQRKGSQNYAVPQRH